VSAIPLRSLCGCTCNYEALPAKNRTILSPMLLS
jgi:hypothetical protein